MDRQGGDQTGGLMMVAGPRWVATRRECKWHVADTCPVLKILWGKIIPGKLNALWTRHELHRLVIIITQRAGLLLLPSLLKKNLPNVLLGLVACSRVPAELVQVLLDLVA